MSFNETTTNSTELNFEAFNSTICNDEHFKLSQRNLIMIYLFLCNFYLNKQSEKFNNYLNKTTYFNKIIFLKYLKFFINLNNLQERQLNILQERIIELEEGYDELNAEIQELEDSEDYEINIKIIEKKMKTKMSYENKINGIKEKMAKIETNFEDIKSKFLDNTRYILNETKDIYDFMNADYMLTLFDKNIINGIYSYLILNINNPDRFSDNFNEYMTLFNLNPIKTKSSNKAIFYIGVHGTLLIVVPNNTYLTIASPVNTTINRWGERGESIKYLNSMDYTFKQCLLAYGESLTNDVADTCFDLLGKKKNEYNLDTRQTTPAYCAPEPSNYFSNLTDFNKNEKMRIKHYTVDSYGFMIFNTDYTIPDNLFTNLSLKIPKLTNKQYNTAENIMNLNFLLFTNNINFTIFNIINIASIDDNDDEPVYPFGLYPDIGLYNRYFLQEGNTYLQSDLHNYYFPLDIFSLKSRLFTGDFTLDRDIYALNDINIHLKYKNVNISFVLLKGDSFLSNPYIIEYFIKMFNSKITIRPGHILGNKDHDIFTQNSKEPTTRERGSTITCLSKGLSCYKVAISVLTNYEILQFCKDANINTCDLYDTSCQSFEYIDDIGKIKRDYSPPPQQKQTLKRMNTLEDSTMLDKYDNLSDILFSDVIETSTNFKVIGYNIDTKKRKRGGRTQKRINRTNNMIKQINPSHKQLKNTHKQRKNTHKQRKNTHKQTKKIYNKITL